MSINVASGKFRLNFLVVNTLPNVAELKFLVANELVAGVKISPRSNCHIFRTAAAAGNSLVNARAARQINHIVIESKGLAFLVSLKH